MGLPRHPNLLYSAFQVLPPPVGAAFQAARVFCCFACGQLQALALHRHGILHAAAGQYQDAHRRLLTVIRTPRVLGGRLAGWP